jgi:hypothetical protein
MTRTFWLSFCDPHKPIGDQFLGVAIVQVTEADADAARAIVLARFPHARRGADWIAAATRKAHELGCNPGGDVLSVDVTDHWPPPADPDVPLNRLMDRHELTVRGLMPTTLPQPRRAG